MEPDHNQQITSPPKGEDAQEIMMHDAEVPEDTEIPDVHNEPESTMEQDTTTMRAQMEQVLQNPQQCAELMQLCITRTEVLTLYPKI
jgi:hypothetical protein